MSETGKPVRDRPWIFRTYGGHSTAKATNRLYRDGLARGQTGLSVAFDLPTQTGHDSDHELARGEVGKVGVPICHLGDMRALFDGIPLADTNTSMTINATAPWLLALYIAVADEQGADRTKLTGTTQNDIIKEYLSRGTYIFPPEASLKLTADTIAFTAHEMPKWNPVNVCSYHLQEAGATPVQEVAYALATAIAILDRVKAREDMAAENFPRIFGRISFFVNAGLRFVTEMCKMRAFAELWEEIGRERYGVTDEKLLRFRYGVQVNSLGLTEQQPENNVYRILIEMLAVTLSKRARARAVQLPAWNEALGLPRPWDQQWSLRAQQILALETDLLEHEDLFDGAPVVEEKVRALKEAIREELSTIEKMGGAVAGVESGYMKERLVEANAARIEAIERGETTVVGVNAYMEGAPSPLTTGEGDILTVAPEIEAGQVDRLRAWRESRDAAAVRAALDDLAAAIREGRNIMPPSIAAAKAGVTTGEWADCLRKVHGTYRAPTGVARAARNVEGDEAMERLRARVKSMSRDVGRPLSLLIGKPGLDGHSNGAEQIAVRARDAGIDIVYDGIRCTPSEIVRAAGAGKVHALGLSVLSGSHVALAEAVLAGLREAGLGHIPVVVGGIVPPADAERLKTAGVARIYTPKDYRLTDIVAEIVDEIERVHTAG